MSRRSDNCEVLVGFAESLAAIEAIWDLLDSGFVVHAFTRDGASPGIACDPRVMIHRVRPPERDSTETVREITALAAGLGWPVLVPLDDVAVWALDLIWQQNPEARVAGPTGHLARFCLDKRLQLAAARDAGLLVPQTAVYDTGRHSEVTSLPDYPGPYIVRPALAVEVRGGRVGKGATDYVSDGTRLQAALEQRSDVVLVQPVLHGVGHGLFGLARSGEVRNWSAHQRIRMMNPRGSGASACRSVDPAPHLVVPAQRMISEIGWEGLFMLEFLSEPDGTSWFVELNGRTWGSLVLATRRGLRYPTWMVSATLDPLNPTDEVTPGGHVTARHLGREMLHLAFVGRESWSRRVASDSARLGFSADVPSLYRTLRNVLRWNPGDVAYNWCPRRKWVLVADTMQTVLEGIIRLRP